MHITNLNVLRRSLTYGLLTLSFSEECAEMISVVWDGSCLEEGKVGIRVFATNMDDEGQFPKKKVSDAKESMLSSHRLDSERSLTAGDERARARRLWSNTRRSDCEARPTSRKTLN